MGGSVAADNMMPGYDVYLDSLNGGGSQSGGGVRVSIDDWSASGHVRYATSTSSGSAGAIESSLLVKEGAAPTQDQLIFVELTFKTDKTFVGGSYGGVGQGGKLAPK